MIVTSSWFTTLDPARFCRIGISRGVPRGQTGFRRFPSLNPGRWFNSVTPEEYRHLYYEEVLSRLDPARVVTDLEAMAGEKIAALLCWEPPSPGAAWCHRGFVSEWLFDELGLEIFEVGREGCGCGHHHPKLPQTSQQPSLF
ncbi:MAG: hypothetical protein JSR99_09955 [Proteobacteria bacterium]|nr:hypothetical protein [Pseudomonadota bacterium]